MAKKKKASKTRKRHLFRNTVLLLILMAGLFIAWCFVNQTDEESIPVPKDIIPNLEIPVMMPGYHEGEIIRHNGYTLSYNEEHEQPNWVAYELTRNEVVDVQTERIDNFREDKMVSSGSATPADYKKSGYDRGHLAPSRDLTWSFDSMNDSFYMSNMSPQRGEFNRGIWADLEAVVRTNAYESGRLQVVTGPVLTDGPYEKIGKSGVSVPDYYYKVLLDYEQPGLKAIGFILPNEGSDRKLESYAVSVDEVEELTGIDFFPALPDDIEEKLESSYRTSLWSFDTYLPADASIDPNEAAAYVVPETLADRIAGKIKLIWNKIKYNIFEMTGTEDLARDAGLI